MRTACVNIKGHNYIYPYMIKYNDSDFNDSSVSWGYNENDIYLNSDLNLIREDAVWNKIYIDKHKSYLPNIINVVEISLLFPKLSCPSINYVLDAYISINGHRVYLGNHYINKLYLTATTDRLNGNDYFEEYQFYIVDPKDVLYSDDWKEWRLNICGGETEGVSSVCFSLHSVNVTENGYMNDTEYEGGQSSIKIIDNFDITRLEITPDILSKNINCELIGDVEAVKNTNGLKIQYELVVQDSENIYKISSIETDFSTKKVVFSDIIFNDWAEFLPGLKFKSTATIKNDLEDIIVFRSNDIPITQEIFSYYFVNNGFPNNINLNELNMETYNINIVNKTINNIVKMDSIDTAKNNIVQTVFYKSVDSANIIVHPSVTETICINLDSYKNIVKNFVLQLEGVAIIEIGRVPAGVLFKIVGNNLPKQQTSGTYYILNENSEMVTSGKYNYVV